jgi:murein L,D-transpeptidase YcbB/YkuD
LRHLPNRDYAKIVKRPMGLIKLLAIEQSRKNLFVMAALSALVAVLFLYTPANATTFTRGLTVGSRGDDVTALQKILKDEGVYPDGLVTGYFGQATRAAVKKFQAKYGIAQVGNVGPTTRAKLNEIDSAPLPAQAGISFRDIQNQLASIIQDLKALLASRPILQEKVTAMQIRIQNLKSKIIAMLGGAPQPAAQINPTIATGRLTLPTKLASTPSTSSTIAINSSSAVAAAQKTLTTLDTIQTQLSNLATSSISSSNSSTVTVDQVYSQVDQLLLLQQQMLPSITVTPTGNIQMNISTSGLLMSSSSQDMQDLQSQIDAMQKLMQQMNSQLLNPGSAIPSQP